MWPKVRSSPRRNTGRLVALFNFKTKFTPGLFAYLILNQLPSHNTLIDQCHIVGFPKLNAANRVKGPRNTPFLLRSRSLVSVRFQRNQSKPFAFYIYSNAVFSKADSSTLKGFLISFLRWCFFAEKACSYTVHF